MSEIAKDPVFRSQYEGGVKEDAQVEAAMNGAPVSEELNQPPKRSPGAVSDHGIAFGKMVKLR